MIKQNKTKLTLMFFGILFAGIMIAACSNASDSAKTETKDSVAAPAAAPEVKPDSTAASAAGDSGVIKGNTKPTPEKP